MSKQDGRPAYQELLAKHPQLAAAGGAGSFELLSMEPDIAAAQAAAGDRLQRKGLPLDWAKVGIAYEDQYLYILRDAVRFPSPADGAPGALGTYIRIVPKPIERTGVAMLCVREGKVVLQDHFRHATRSWQWEIPRGFVDAGETCEQAARREIREEMGADVLRFDPLGDCHPNSGLSAEVCTLLLAQVGSTGVLERAEAIREIRLFTIAELEDMIRMNRITDGFTLAAYARARAAGLLPHHDR